MKLCTHLRCRHARVHGVHIHIRGVLVALLMMTVGSSIAVYQPLHIIGLGHLAQDVIAYFLHGVGAIPLVKHVEPVMLWLAGEV